LGNNDRKVQIAADKFESFPGDFDQELNLEEPCKVWTCLESCNFAINA
jgi:hypothetical protein